MRLLKYIAYVLMVCIALVGGGIVFLTTYVNPNDYKPEISAQVAEKTGKTLIINGNISWSFFPWLGVIVRDAQLNSGKQTFAKIQEASVEVKVLPLLHKKVEIGSLTLKGLDLHLIKNAQGENNWDSLLPAEENKNPQPTAPATPEHQKFNISISNIDISNTRIVWEDQQKGEKITVRDLSLHAENTQLHKPFPISLSLTADIKKLAITVKAEGTVDNKAESINISKLSTSIANMVANGQFKINNFSAPNIQGQLQIPEFNPREFLKVINQKAPVTYDASVLKTASASLNLKGTVDNMRIDNLKARLDDTQVAGTITVQNKNANINATLDKIQIDRYLESKEKPAKLILTNVRTNLTTHLTTNNSDGTIQIGAIQAGEIRATELNAPLSIQNNVVSLNGVTAQFYQGKYNGNLKVDMSTPNTHLSSQQSLTAVQMQPLLNDLKALTQVKVDGVGNLDTQFTATGKDTASMTRSLNGQVKFNVDNGILHGIDLDHILSTFLDTMDTLFRNIKSSPSALFDALKVKLDPAMKGGSGQTKFTSFTGNINIVNGIAQNNDLLLKTTAETTVTGSGNANLITQQIDYRLNLSKINPKTNKPYDEILPVLVSGPFANPSIRVDPNFINQLIQKEIAKQAQKQLTNVVEQAAKKHLGDDLGGKVTEQLKNLDLNKLFR